MKRIVLSMLAMLLIAASPAEETEHVVKEGETLNGIANRAGVSASAIAEANGLKQPYTVRIGQKLKIPRKGSRAKPAASAAIHEVKEGETLNGIANRAGVSASELARANGLAEPYVVRVGQKLKIPGRGAARVIKDAKPAGGKAQGGEAYIVKDGETLGGIANRAGVPRIMIIEANGLKEPYAVRAGQKLIIPRQHRHTVAEGETGFSIAYKYGVPFSEIAVANNLPQNGVLKTGQTLVIPAIIAKDGQSAAGQGPAKQAQDRFIWPLEGEILAPFNSTDSSRGHNGIDIAASIGAPVKASRDGKVIFAGDEPVRYGKMVIIAHDGGWHSAYGHLSSISARKGAQVSMGDVIGHAGSTGEAEEPELHFELRKANRPVDPVKQLATPTP